MQGQAAHALSGRQVTCRMHAGHYHQHACLHTTASTHVEVGKDWHREQRKEISHCAAEIIGHTPADRQLGMHGDPAGER
jgi:hypothetical protein